MRVRGIGNVIQFGRMGEDVTLSLKNSLINKNHKMKRERGRGNVGRRKNWLDLGVGSI